MDQNLRKGESWSQHLGASECCRLSTERTHTHTSSVVSSFTPAAPWLLGAFCRGLLARQVGLSPSDLSLKWWTFMSLTYGVVARRSGWPSAPLKAQRIWFLLSIKCFPSNKHSLNRLLFFLLDVPLWTDTRIARSWWIAIINFFYFLNPWDFCFVENLDVLWVPCSGPTFFLWRFPVAALEASGQTAPAIVASGGKFGRPDTFPNRSDVKKCGEIKCRVMSVREGVVWLWYASLYQWTLLSLLMSFINTSVYWRLYTGSSS